jgi:glycosyltransferase involved in cell wall biosynthesis
VAEREAPRFSIVVPAYNAAGTLAEAVDAILGQTFSDWNCLIVDDGSVDMTLATAQGIAHKDSRVRVLHQDNQGTAGAYNAGVSKVHGDFVVICSADDVLLPEHLASMATFIEAEPEYDIYTANGYLWRPPRTRELIYDRGTDDAIRSMSLADVIHVCFYGVGAAYRRELFDRVDGYRLGVFGEDYDFWLRAMALGARHRYLPKPLSLWRVSKTQKSAQLESVYRSDMRLVSDLRRDFDLSPEELAAVEESIADRERLIAELHRPRELYRDVIKPLPKQFVIGALGRDRARRLKRVVRSAVGRASAMVR